MKQLRIVAGLGQAPMQRSPHLSTPFPGHSRMQSTLSLRQVIQQSHRQRQHRPSIRGTTGGNMLISPMMQTQPRI